MYYVLISMELIGWLLCLVCVVDITFLYECKVKDPILWLFCRYKVAVAMPNLDELLKGTPVRRFASVWHKWRNIPLYPIHYSELIRLAALYKYVLFLQIIHIGFSSLTVVIILIPVLAYIV